MTIYFPSNNEALLFGQHRLAQNCFVILQPEVKNNPRAELWIVLGSLETTLGNNMFQYATNVRIMAQYEGSNPLRACVRPDSPLTLLEEPMIGPLLLVMTQCSDCCHKIH